MSDGLSHAKRAANGRLPRPSVSKVPLPVVLLEELQQVLKRIAAEGFYVENADGGVIDADSVTIQIDRSRLHGVV